MEYLYTMVLLERVRRESSTGRALLVFAATCYSPHVAMTTVYAEPGCDPRAPVSMHSCIVMYCDYRQLTVLRTLCSSVFLRLRPLPVTRKPKM